jgi:hypothetical protein
MLSVLVAVLAAWAAVPPDTCPVPPTPAPTVRILPVGPPRIVPVPVKPPA